MLSKKLIFLVVCSSFLLFMQAKPVDIYSASSFYFTVLKEPLKNVFGCGTFIGFMVMFLLGLCTLRVFHKSSIVFSMWR